MSKLRPRHYRVARRIAIFLAAAPLFQLTQCQTGINQVFATAFNNAPATFYSVLQSIALLPIQLLIGGGAGGGTGGTGDSGLGGF